MAGDNRLNIENIDPDLNHYIANTNNFKQYSIDSFVKHAVRDKICLSLFHNNARSIMK